MKKNFFKKFLTFSPVMLSSFFLFTLFVNMNKVNASTIDITLTDEMFSYLNNINNYIDTANSLCVQSNPISCDYYIRYNNDYNYTNLYLLLNKSSQTNPRCYTSSNKLYCNNDTTKYDFSDNGLSLSTTGTYYASSEWQAFQYDPNGLGVIRLLLYSSFDIPWDTNNHDTYNFIYNNNTYSIIASSETHAPTLYDLKNIFLPPVPDDDFPVLTSFINVSLEKLSLICDFITSNYIYLTIFVIFLFYFIILMFRRLS